MLLCIIGSRFIYLIRTYSNHSFLWLSNILLHIYTTPSLTIHLSMDSWNTQLKQAKAKTKQNPKAESKKGEYWLTLSTNVEASDTAGSRRSNNGTSFLHRSLFYVDFSLRLERSKNAPQQLRTYILPAQQSNVKVCLLPNSTSKVSGGDLIGLHRVPCPSLYQTLAIVANPVDWSGLCRGQPLEQRETSVSPRPHGQTIGQK